MIALTVQRRSLPLRRAIRTAHEELNCREVLLVSLEEDGRPPSWGEAAPLPWAGTEDFAACESALSRVGQVLGNEGVEVEDPQKWGAWLSELLPGRPAARWAIDLALWDRKARREELPLALALGRHGAAGELGLASPAAEVPTNALLSGEPVEAAQDAIAEGYSVLKIKVGTQPLDQERGFLEAIRSFLPQGVSLRLDANGAWPDAPSAEAALRQLGLDAVESVEQPVPAAAHEELADLNRRLPVPVAADESVCDPRAAVALLNAGLPRLVLKPARLGGLGPCMEIAAAARRRGAELVVTTFLDGAVGRAGALHLAAALGAGDLPHGLATGQLFRWDLAPPAVSDGPRMRIPKRCGLGVAP